CVWDCWCLPILCERPDFDNPGEGMEIRGIGGAGQGVCPRGTLAPALLASARSCAGRSALHGSTARAAPPWAPPLARLMATTRACPRGTARDLLGCAGWCGSRSALHGSTARAAPPWAHPLARLMATTWAC